LRLPLIVAKTTDWSLRKGGKNQERAEYDAKHA
jgi:hypothetical protein